jgi:hypothetical protein
VYFGGDLSGDGRSVMNTFFTYIIMIGVGVVIFQLSAINSLLRDIRDLLDLTVKPRKK